MRHHLIHRQLGGTSIEEHGRYVLGDDAIGCLKDLRRWLKFYDEKLSRLDVQRALAESNFVKGDVLEILADWPETGKDSKLRFKVSLLCRRYPFATNLGPIADLVSGNACSVNLDFGDRRRSIYSSSP